MKIFLTGHRGFLGSHLAKSLLARGHCLENFEQRLTPRLIRDMPFEGCDACVHLASRTPQSARIDESIDYRDDVQVTKAIAERWLQSETRLIFASTSNVYRQSDGLLSESSPVTADVDYAHSKLESEQALLEFAKDGLDCFILRLFNPFGTGQSTAYFIPYVLQQVLSNKEIELKNPNNVRDYVYIDDVMEVLVKTIEFETEKYLKMDVSPVFNIGSGRGVTGLQLIQTVEAILGRKANVTLPSVERESNSYVADCSKAIEILKFKVSLSLEQGLRLVVNALSAS